MSTSKAVQQKQTSALAEKADNSALLAQYGEDLEANRVAAQDILMPVMLLMQPTSQLVTAEKAKSGEWRGSLSENLLAARGDTVEVIPFGFHKTWVVFKREPNKTKPEFVRVEPYNVRPNREREETIAGVMYQNFETINYLVVPTSEVLSVQSIPYLLRFRSTAFVTGKKMETMRFQVERTGRPHCFSTVKIGSVFKENEKGKFYIPTVEWGRNTTEEELAAIDPWRKLAQAGVMRADDADLVREDGEGSSGSTHATSASNVPPPADGDRRSDY